MKIRLVIFLLLSFLYNYSVYSQNNSGVINKESKMSLGYDSRIGNFPKKEFENTPPWNPEKEEPLPLSFHTAIEKSWGNLKNVIPATDKKWIVHEAVLAHIGNYKWIYTVEFYCFEKDCNPAANRFLTVIKMDGATFKSKLDFTNWNISNPNFEKRIDSTFCGKGNEYRTRTTVESLKNTLSWNPETKDETPLSLKKALEIGREQAKRFMLPTDYNLSVSEISMRHLGNNKWIYEIDFDCDSKECDFNSSSFQTFIRMDGTVIEPAIATCK